MKLWGEALIRVNASSVNPSDVDSVEGGGCVTRDGVLARLIDPRG